ncbi:hypothetical protein BD779DRAFT_160809 [Infundibulicybe gibba]|nr:hypothetical protein BD779DRAFT_160809 [Infundibulicybe gibba]
MMAGSSSRGLVVRVVGYRELEWGANAFIKQGHLMLVGPRGNPANLQEVTDNIFAMFNKIVTCGNADIIKNLLYPTKFS